MATEEEEGGETSISHSALAKAPTKATTIRSRLFSRGDEAAALALATVAKAQRAAAAAKAAKAAKAAAAAAAAAAAIAVTATAAAGA